MARCEFCEIVGSVNLGNADANDVAADGRDRQLPDVVGSPEDLQGKKKKKVTFRVSSAGYYLKALLENYLA